MRKKPKTFKGYKGACLPILNYHGIQSREDEYLWLDSEKPYVVSADDFGVQMHHMVDGGIYSLTLSGLDHWLNSEGKRGAAVMLTFDDGHVSHVKYVAPYLKQLKLKAVFFIPVRLIGQREQMGWSQLKDLLIEGFEIGSHGFRHIPLTDLKEHELRQELEKSKKVLEDHLCVKIESFSIPRGFYRPRIARMASQIGYRFVFTSQFDLNRRTQDPLRLRRLVVKRDLPLAKFSRMIQGELGFKRQKEQVKEMARRLLKPSTYDALAMMRRAIKVGN